MASRKELKRVSCMLQGAEPLYSVTNGPLDIARRKKEI